MAKRSKTKPPPIHRPLSTAISPDMSLAEKLARFRRRVMAQGYFNHKHPSIQVKHDKKPLRHKSKARHRHATEIQMDSYARRTFTTYEIEAMWLALCRLMDYFGGNKTLLVRTCDVTLNAVNHWIKTGRIAPLGADIIGNTVEVPFTREELRPDLSEKAWAKFDRKKAKLYAHRENLKGNTRYEKSEDQDFDDSDAPLADAENPDDW